MTNAELADEIERHAKFAGHHSGRLGTLLRPLLPQIIAALRRQPSSDQVFGYEEYHDGVIGVFKMSPDGSRNLKILTPQASEQFRAMLAAAEAEGHHE